MVDVVPSESEPFDAASARPPRARLRPASRHHPPVPARSVGLRPQHPQVKNRSPAWRRRQAAAKVGPSALPTPASHHPSHSANRLARAHREAPCRMESAHSAGPSKRMSNLTARAPPPASGGASATLTRPSSLISPSSGGRSNVPVRRGQRSLNRRIRHLLNGRREDSHWDTAALSWAVALRLRSPKALCYSQ